METGYEDDSVEYIVKKLRSIVDWDDHLFDPDLLYEAANRLERMMENNAYGRTTYRKDQS